MEKKNLDSEYGDWKKGDNIIIVRDNEIQREGILLTDSEYAKTWYGAGHIGTIKFNDGETKKGTCLHTGYYFRIKR